MRVGCKFRVSRPRDSEQRNADTYADMLRKEEDQFASSPLLRRLPELPSPVADQSYVEFKSSVESYLLSIQEENESRRRADTILSCHLMPHAYSKIYLGEPSSISISSHTFLIRESLEYRLNHLTRRASLTCEESHSRSMRLEEGFKACWVSDDMHRSSQGIVSGGWCC